MFKKLVVVGDSFCADRLLDTDWPLRLANMYSVPLSGKGLRGRGWWACRDWIQKNTNSLDQNTVVIICHTAYHRLPHRTHLPVNAGVLHTEVSSQKNDLLQFDPEGKLHRLVKEFYQSDLYVDEFYNWAWRAWLAEVNKLATKVNKIIHLPGPCVMPSFENPYRNSIVVQPTAKYKGLMELSKKELRIPEVLGSDVRHNHLSTHNNCKLAEALYTIINAPVATNDNPVYFDNFNEWLFTDDEFVIRDLSLNI